MMINKINKVSLELGNVNRILKLKFNILVNEDMDKPTDNTVSRFSIDNTNYTRLILHPFITLDIRASKDKLESWNNNMSINLNKLNTFKVLPIIQEMITNFNIKEMYYYMDGVLHINKKLVNDNQRVIQINDKALCFIYDTHYSDNENRWYEVVRMCINTYDYYCKLTLLELKYLYYQLNKIDMDVLAVELYRTYLMDKKLNNTYEKLNRTITEKVDNDNSVNIPLNSNKEIPDL